MAGLLQGKKGIILGVANNRSLAWSCAQLCAQEGAELIFNFLGAAQEKRLKELITSLPGADAFPCDVSKDEEIEAFFKNVKNKWDGIDFIIHSVAFADKEDLKSKFLTVSRSNFAMAMDISAYSLVAVTKASLDMLRSGGSIVAMTYYGSEKVVPKYNVMGVAKAALEACTRYLAEDLGSMGVRVNCVSAGPIRTLSSSAIPGIRGMLDAAQKFAPLRRNITGEDVAKSTVYLLSDLASAVTGEVLHVDCGYHALGMFGTENNTEATT